MRNVVRQQPAEVRLPHRLQSALQRGLQRFVYELDGRLVRDQQPTLDELGDHDVDAALARVELVTQHGTPRRRAGRAALDEPQQDASRLLLLAPSSEVNTDSAWRAIAPFTPPLRS